MIKHLPFPISFWFLFTASLWQCGTSTEVFKSSWFLGAEMNRRILLCSVIGLDVPVALAIYRCMLKTRIKLQEDVLLEREV